MHAYPAQGRRQIVAGLALTLAGWMCAVSFTFAQSPLVIDDEEGPVVAVEVEIAEAKEMDVKELGVAKDCGKPSPEVQPAVLKENGPEGESIVDPQITPASSCCGGGGLLNAPTSAGGGCCGGGNGGCIPGRQPCTWCDYDTVCGRIIGAFHDCICCPDPCYEPRWIAEANAAFFQDSARPVTQTRLRYDGALNWSFPDTSEFFWAKIGGNGPGAPELGVNASTFLLYQEIAAKGFSFFVEMPYTHVEPTLNTPHAGFGDVNLGTKSLFLDCELIQMAFQFRTYIPAGSAGSGLGTGHVSLEPALLTTVKLAPLTYLQTELAQWIAVGGDSAFAGGVMHYHFSLNHGLWHPNESVSLVGTVELNGYTFQNGQYTDITGLTHGASQTTFLQFGPGLRFGLCNKIDLGFGAGFGLSDHGPEQDYRVDFRVRF